MCTKYNLNDNPEVFKQFIPRNLSKSEIVNDACDEKYMWVLTPCIKKHCDSLYLHEVSDFSNCKHKSRKNSSHNENGYHFKIDDNLLLSVDSGYNNRQRSQSASNYKSRDINRKTVRFADDLGLNLSHIKLIKTAESQKPPILSSAAVQYLNLDHNKHLAMQGIKYFSQISGIKNEADIYNTARQINVCLEKASINGMTLFGSIVVKNLTFEKLVGIRISFDNWITFNDIFGSYILESSVGEFDKFSFSIVIPHNVIVGTSIQFSAFYWAQNGVTYWDNNNNRNYTFECYAKIMNIVNENGWMNFL